jgi:hypothetical protein
MVRFDDDDDNNNNNLSIITVTEVQRSIIFSKILSCCVLFVFALTNSVTNTVKL